MKKLTIFCLLAGFLCFVAAQDKNDSPSEMSNAGVLTETDEINTRDASLVGMANPQIAMATTNYQVTAGDVYTLAYNAGSIPVTYMILVDSSYKIRVSNLGILDAGGKTYLGLKSEVERVVTKNYPMSGVQFALTQPAVFKIILKGEVKRTSEPIIWALSRLSSVVDKKMTPYASVRDIQVTSADGTVKYYDLFQASRFGDLSQDPYLRPGDIISIRKYERSVNIKGEVQRPGVYQLRSGENLAELVNLYGGGLTPVADSSRIELSRNVGSVSVSGDKIYLQQENIASNYQLQNYDSISVARILDLTPVMFFEGAINNSGEDDTVTGAAVPEANNRVPVRFLDGENYASLVRKRKTMFSSVSDTEHAYIIRGDERIPINLNPMLYDASYRSKFFVETNDILVIPFSQFFVSVSGAVEAPGRYPYIPDRGWDYYIALAGGFKPERNTNSAVVIRDITGKTQSKDAPITPETVIEAQNNAFLFYFNQYAPIITTTLSIISTLLTAIALSQ